ncbi:MAG: EAL domain-containing protein [Burkholderiaceae bacterium]|nr:EAL domain-containing protein [Burkholderiaceae bacterium]
MSDTPAMPANRPDDSRLAVIITWLAATIALVVTLSGPAGYYVLSKEAELREAKVAARLHAAFITQVIQGSGENWRAEISGLIEAELAPSELPEQRAIIGVGGTLVSVAGPTLPRPRIEVSAPLLTADGPVGEVRITRSIRAIYLRTLLTAMFSAALGAAIYLSLRLLPLRALRRTLSELKNKEARAREEAEDNLRLVFQHALEGIMILSRSGQILSTNPAAAAMFGYPEDVLRTMTLDALLVDDQVAHADESLPLARFETSARRCSGERLPVEVAISESGISGTQHRIAIVRDITERKQAQERLSRMANFDSLTGLPNRSSFRERLGHAMSRARDSRAQLALMFLDIDRFKTINDSLGHDFGDRLLVQVASRLSSCIRSGDTLGRGETRLGDNEVYRLGGDEFTVLIEALTGPEPAAQVAKRILHTLAEPFVIGEHELFISASIGITVFPDDPDEQTDLDGLIRQADMAMYHSKEAGRDTHSFYNAELNASATERHMLETSLRHAFERGEFHLVYQPKANLSDGAITGVEALIRWRRPDLPPIGPDKFIPILEETGLIVPVGGWVLREACRQVVAWDAQGLPPVNLAVNLSARQFRQADLIEQIAATLRESGLAASRLEIELTESTLIEDTEMVTRIMASLGALGVAVAIDDFGTGHSSLSYLKRFDVDTLKIDRSFVRDTPDDPEDNAIAIAVIALAHGLGLKVVAEGVENEAQADFLRAQHCDQIQGYLLSEALGPNDLAHWLRERQPAAMRAVTASSLALSSH